eukprot:c53977_g1_i1 orf=334-591(-)
MGEISRLRRVTQQRNPHQSITVQLVGRKRTMLGEVYPNRELRTTSMSSTLSHRAEAKSNASHPDETVKDYRELTSAKPRETIKKS